MSVIGTLVVPFGDEAVSGAGGAIVAEWDDTMNLDANGQVKTQWQPGDAAYLLLHNDGSVRVLAVKATAGSIVAAGAANLSRQATLGFSAAGEKQGLQYLPAGPLSFVWKGNVGQGAGNVGKEVSVAAGQFPCLAEVSYPVDFSRYRLQTPAMMLAAEETFPIRVYVYYEEVKP